jgi:hypothetical protein
MNKTQCLLLGLIIVITMSTVKATIINFKDIANNGEIGLQDYSPVSGLTINAYSTETNGKEYAYLDAGWGGLGVCKAIDSNAQCNPSSDDNTTVGELLTFVFEQDTLISKIWFNNNHGEDKSLLGDMINISGIGNYLFLASDQINVIGSNSDWLYSTPLNVSANTDFNISYMNEEFYVTAIEYSYINVRDDITVSEPSILSLMLLSLLVINY